MRPLLTLLLVASIAPACDTGAEPPPDPLAVRQTIESLNAELERWYAAGQIDSVAMVFTQDAWQMPPNSAPLVGRDSLRAFWTAAAEWGRWIFDLQTQDVVVADSIAVERGRFNLRFEPGPAAPMPGFEDRGHYVVLWRQESDGQWRIVWDAPVSELPPPGAPAAGDTSATPGDTAAATGDAAAASSDTAAAAADTGSAGRRDTTGVPRRDGP